MDFGQHMEVASLDATEEMMVVASFPPIPIGFNHHEDTYPYPSSEHLGSLVWCFLDSVAWATAVADIHSSSKVGCVTSPE